MQWLQAPPTNHTHLDGLNNLPEWQLGGQCVAMVDDGLAAPCHIESWWFKKKGGSRTDMCHMITTTHAHNNMNIQHINTVHSSEEERG